MWTDGSTVKKKSTHSTGDCGIGVVIVDMDNQKVEYLFGEYIGVSTNNYAEFFAIQRALEVLLERQHDFQISSIEIATDSKIAAEILVGNYKTDKPHLLKVVKNVRRLERKLGVKVDYFWVAGHSGVELNELADLLAYTTARG